MHYAGAGAHPLHITIAKYGSVAHAVLVGQLTVEDIGNNFHIPVPVGTEAFGRLNPVFIDNEKWPETSVARIVVMPEGKRVMGMQPSQIGEAAIFTFTHFDHGDLLMINVQIFRLP